VIRTERLLLRPAEPGDLEAFHAILCDPAATAFWSTPPHRSLDETRDWLGAMIACDPQSGEDFAVELDGRVIGKAGLYRFPEIGFIFHPGCWGRGLATEAIRPILDRSFARHALDRVTADVDPRNRRSLALLERLGFRRIGTRERSWLMGEQWCDSVDLVLDVSDWRGEATA
jgi:[ribosomal protein S5]-alanine N-acetyltransferase